MLYNSAVYDLLVRKKGLDQTCLFARSGTVGSQRFPVHWGGDCDSEWYGMAESLRGGLSLGLSGFPYYAHDIGGFKAEGSQGGFVLATPEAEIYKRWLPFGLLSSHSRLHGSGSYRVPWLFGPEACRVLSKFTKLKHRLEPLITTLSVKDANKSGLPFLRAMFLEFPEDPTCWLLDQQYMFGDKLLVAPIFDPNTVHYYVPHSSGGLWFNILDGSSKVGGRWYTEDYDMLHLPLLLRPNTIVLLCQENHFFGRPFEDQGFTILVGGLYERSGETTVTLRNGHVISATVTMTEDSGHHSTLRGNVAGVAEGLPLEVVVLGECVGLDNYATAGKRWKLGVTPEVELNL